MAAAASLSYLGNGIWLYRGEQGAALVTGANLPVLNTVIREGGHAVVEVGETVAPLVGDVIDISDIKDIAVTAANGEKDQAIEDGTKFTLGFMAGLVVTNPVFGFGAGLAYGAAINNLEHNPNANLAYAHEFNFDGSPYHQESNLLNPPVPRDITRELRDFFNRSEIAYANGTGPDGQPWGTTTQLAPNATSTWELSPQPGYATLTTEVNNGSGSVTRITQTVDRQTGSIQATYVHEDGHLIATTDHTHGQAWVINRATGEMESTDRPAGGPNQAIGEGALPPPRPPSTSFIHPSGDHTVTLNPGGTLSDIVLLEGREGNPVTVADLLSANPQYTDVNRIPAGAELNVPVRSGDVLTIYRADGAVETINTRTAEITSTTVDAQGNTHQVVSRPDGEGGRLYIERTLHAGTGEVVATSAVRVDTLSGQVTTVDPVTLQPVNATGSGDAQSEASAGFSPLSPAQAEALSTHPASGSPVNGYGNPSAPTPSSPITPNAVISPPQEAANGFLSLGELAGELSPGQSQSLLLALTQQGLTPESLGGVAIYTNPEPRRQPHPGQRRRRDHWHARFGWWKR